MPDSLVSQIGLYLLFSLFMCVGFSVLGGSILRRFGSVGLSTYWATITLAATGGCIFALSGGTLSGLLIYVPRRADRRTLASASAACRLVESQVRRAHGE